ncbi:lipopolysaccharide biosynthesis protein [Pseudomonas sp. BGI-2]|uniref:lipopolysaccharide biosynthesis protein n=1 Tax=Pseudomonas sp. BGI-2 TaxID=2528211 RepID=UPI001033FD5D|nr:oligosaccharide flippase family protein [Pseudomonas sp. BGI-2]TBN43361.1 hypothetical protein EYC95_16890 [Pseudomonas sp. BGI-2]
MRLRNAAIGNMLMLYAGKTSSLLVAFVFLPLYNRLLGPEQFGVVAVILSLQALLVMMDLGMSTLVGREVAVASSRESSCIKLIRTAELSLSVFYAIILFGALLASNLGWFIGTGSVVISGVVLLFLLLVLQNLYYSLLIANRDYAVGSFVQVIGVAARACATAYVLSFHSASLQAFIITQLIFGFIHWWVSRIYCMKKISENESSDPELQWPKFSDALALTRAGSALVLFSAAGAAVTQLDKPIISMFVSAASVSPYYLASLLCMTPISILASPVSQYFQPLFLKEAVNGFSASAKQLTGRFVYSIFLVTALPTLVLWWFRAPIIDIWVGESGDNVILSRYVEILLPGLAVGALGFVPYNLLVFAKDFRFQAIFSACLTIITLCLVTFAAKKQNVEAICIIYSLYHAFSTLGSWCRAIILPETRPYARYAGIIAVSLTTVFVSIIGFSSFLLF